MAPSLHTLLVHAPKWDSRYGPLGPAATIHMMAVGLPALAEVVEGTGRSVQLMHLGVERLVDPAFDVGDTVRALRPRLVGFSLHWHPQSWHTIEAIRQVKAACPDTFIVVGGFTATAFARQLLEAVPAVDAVVRGDGERPLEALVAAVDAGADLSQVPNLSWRSAGQIHDNPQTWTVDRDTLSGLGFERFDLLRHADTYIRHCGLHYVPHSRRTRGLMRLAQRVFGGSGRFMVLPAGRGCSVNCAWCGGGWGAHKRLHGRTGPVKMHPGRLAALVGRSVDWGFDGVHACFDPHPRDPSDWVEVCARVRSSSVRTGMLFESFQLPHPELVQALSRTFLRPVIAISPESPREAVRHKVRGLPFTNDALVESVALCARHGVDVLLSFGMGLPGEDVGALDEAVALHARCLSAARSGRRAARVLLRTFPIELEPGAPWADNPEQWGITAHRSTFRDYLEAHAPGARGPKQGLGFSHPTYFREDGRDFATALREEGCARMCPLPPGPRLGHHSCAALRRMGGDPGPCVA